MVLTKRDQAAGPEPFARNARSLRPRLPVEVIKALVPEALGGARTRRFGRMVRRAQRVREWGDS